jgi:ketosteroid isomerase-like protein
MPTPDAKTYAEQWVRAWNAHDIEAVLDHFHDDVLFTSPVAARVLPETGGWCAARTRCGTTGLQR